ncbi:MAG: bifunctional polysaccharide deacetylase/glycosyltransferase family 2 protein [Acidimicrobiales bacterium]
MLLAFLTAALLMDGYSTHQVGRASTSSPAPSAGLNGVGPVLDLSGPQIRSAEPLAATIALTFDDGPDPRWTPQVLAVLRRHGVPATFFVIGASVAAHPGLVRAELRDGDEIGSHTFTHVDLGAVSGWRDDLELGLTQSAIAGATGKTTSLLRPPYSSGSDGLTIADFRAARAASRFGYLVVLANRDGEDWRRPGVGRIVQNASPAGRTGAIILLHDGGGDRSQTVAALDLLIPELQARGYHFATLSDAVGLPRGSTSRSSTAVERLQGRALLAALAAAHVITHFMEILLIPLGILALLRSILVVIFARRHVRGVRDAPITGFAPAVSVIVPAYNEEVGIAATVRSIAASTHRPIEIVVVDDGSTDRTAEIVEGLGYANVRVLRKANGGKPSALNAGIAAATHDIIVMVDGDTVFEPDTITYLVQPLARPTVGAVSGNTKVGNRRGVLGRWQHIEYVLGFNLDRRMYDVLQCMPTVPGAIGAFRREALIQVGGVSDDTLAEDTDLTMATIRAGWDVVYEERAHARTEAPAAIGALWRQRYRWSYGTMQAMWKHRAAVLSRGNLGRIGLPYLVLFQVLLPLLAPAIDLWALYGILFLNPIPVLAYWGAFNALQLGLGVYAFRLDGEPLRPLWAAPIQQFVYRQLMYLVVIQSALSAVVGTRLRWHKQHRTGLNPL